MSLFNIFKKKNTLEENKQIIENDPLENFPELLSAKLLFIEKPNLDGNQLLAGVKNTLQS